MKIDIDKTIMSPGLLTAKEHNRPIVGLGPGIDLATAISKIKEIQDGNPFYESALTLVKAADYALANAQTPREAKDVADKLKGIEAYLKRLTVAKLASNQIVAQRLRIERAIGAMINEDGEIRRGAQAKGERLPRVTLHGKYGIRKNLSHRWQKYSRLDPIEFEDWVTKNQESNELSGAWLLRIVEDLDPEPPPVRTWEQYARAALNSVDAMLWAPGVTQDIEDKGREIVASLQWLLDKNLEVE
jgi:hypothetical protein